MNATMREPAIAILQARTSSTRLPGKVLAPILGRPMLARQIERVARSHRIGRLIVATSTQPSDDAVAGVCAQVEVECYRGALDDVLDRFHHAAAQQRAAHVVRLTADCPLTDAAVIDRAIDFYAAGGYDYVSNSLEPTFPDGLDVEVFRFQCLDDAWREARTAYEREHVTPFIYQHPARYRIGHYRTSIDRSHLRWTVDRPEDLEVVKAVYEALYPEKPDFTTEDILKLIERQPALATHNTGRT